MTDLQQNFPSELSDTGDNICIQQYMYEAGKNAKRTATHVRALYQPLAVFVQVAATRYHAHEVAWVLHRRVNTNGTDETDIFRFAMRQRAVNKNHEYFNPMSISQTLETGCSRVRPGRVRSGRVRAGRAE